MSGNTNNQPREISREEYLKMESLLKVLNKPAVKTFKTEHGDIIDCVEINKQPAFDHPLLKNHEIQMRPSSFPKGLKVGAPSDDDVRTKDKALTDDIRPTQHVKIGLGCEGCPEGTVPIRRVLMEDLLRAPSLDAFGKKHYSGTGNIANNDNITPAAGHHGSSSEANQIDRTQQ